MTQVLLIEDEKHKVADLEARLLSLGLSPSEITTVGGVREAVLAVAESYYDLIVLDMALPTFAGRGSDGSGGGAAQAIGGVEVLRMLKLKQKHSKVIIVTQYPEITIDGVRIRLNQAGKVLSTKYKQNVLGAVLYSYSTASWAQQFDTLFRRKS